MKIQSLPDALVHERRDLYNAEKQLTESLPKMAKGIIAKPGARSKTLHSCLDA